MRNKKKIEVCFSPAVFQYYKDRKVILLLLNGMGMFWILQILAILLLISQRKGLRGKLLFIVLPMELRLFKWQKIVTWWQSDLF